MDAAAELRRITSADVRRQALALGFDLCGVAPAESFAELGFFREWLARGYAGEMHNLERSAERRADVRAVMPSARSVISLGTIYNTWGYVVARDWVRRFFAAGPWRIDRPIDQYTGGARAKAVKPRVGVLRPSVVREDAALGVASQIEPFTYRIDRARLVEAARRRIIDSRVSELYYRLYRLL